MRKFLLQKGIGLRLKQIIAFLSLALAIFFINTDVYAAENPAIQLNVSGAIGPAVQDYISRGLDTAKSLGASVVILQLDTPGGLDSSTRKIIQAILASPVPVVTYVSPKGARAASAGTYILYASHIAAMAPGTNLGAASPVSIASLGSKDQNDNVMEKKTMNDASAYIRGLAQLRQRNVQWAEKAVREAVSLSADEALEQNVIDVVASNIPQLLEQINGRSVIVLDQKQILKTQHVPIQVIEPGWRNQFLTLLTNPNIAYILLLVGIYGIFFEFYNPGLVLPGIAGVICLLLSLYALQLLPINFAGFALLIFGIILLITEMLIPSFGIIGFGGIAAFVLGSVFLFDLQQPGFALAWQLIAVMSIVSALFFLIVVNLAVRSHQRKTQTGSTLLIGKIGEVIEKNKNTLQVKVSGEIWKAASEETLHKGDIVIVTGSTNLQLNVQLFSKNDLKTK